MSGQQCKRLGEGVTATGGRARRPLVLLAEAIDAPEVTVAPDLAQGRDVVQRALHELADLGDGARGVESDRKVGLQLWEREAVLEISAAVAKAAGRSACSGGVARRGEGGGGGPGVGGAEALLRSLYSIEGSTLPSEPRRSASLLGRLRFFGSEGPAGGGTSGGLNSRVSTSLASSISGSESTSMHLQKNRVN